MSADPLKLKLGSETLIQLRSDIQTPSYDRGLLHQHTVHIGVGGFHRAHQAMYLDDLLALEGTERWGECGLGVLKSDDRMRDALTGQDFLYTVVERSAEGQSARVVGSLVDYLYAPEQREAAIEKMADAETRIVSLTITEGGYFIDEVTGEFVADHPEIQRDLSQPNAPATSVGLMAEALDRRRRRGLPAFTVMSCDNLQGNGHVIEKVLLGYTSLFNPQLQQWIAEKVAFPNSMVDRITPATTAADITALSNNFGIEDAWPVVTEPFRQWVIEDKFCNGRPQWERVGAELTEDVASYEIMKMRLLNGSHLAMAYPGALKGITYVHEVMAEPLFIVFIQAFMEEVTPVVPIIPGTSVVEYKKTLMHRFSNPTINDQVTRICSEGSAKLPKWLLPSVAELLAQGRPTQLLSFVVGSWLYYLGQGLDENGRALDIIDARAGELRSIAQSGRTDPRPMLAVKSIFGERLATDEKFVGQVESAMQRIARAGVSATIEHCLATAV